MGALWLAIPCQVQGQAGGQWRQSAFGQTVVSLVKVNKAAPNEIAVVASNRLWLTRDSGLMWNSIEVPGLVTCISYDPVQADVMYAGTTAGIYVVRFGISPQLLDGHTTLHQAFMNIIVDDQSIFATTTGGGGTNAAVYRFDRMGNATQLAYPASGAVGFDYDFGHRKLLLTTANGLFVSMNEGATWQVLTGVGHGAGRVGVNGDTIWLSTGDGMYRSDDNGANWLHLGFAGQIDNLNYGSDMRITSLAVTGDTALYGSWGPFTGAGFLVAYSGGGAHSELPLKTNDIAIGGGRVWAATDNGLWVNDSFVTRPQIRRPLVIIPGILGSMPEPPGLLNQNYSYLPDPDDALFPSDNLVLDPITKTYDPLIRHLEELGYRKGSTLFAYPYNWRRDNRDSAAGLALHISDIKRYCQCASVDVVAHSMGGLVARSYIESNSYHNDIANLITIAAPSGGSLDAYPVWEAGDFGDDKSILGVIKKLLVQLESKAHGYVSTVDYIRNEVPSVAQLLPIFNYISGRTYPSGYPRNEYLENLNSADGTALFKQRTAYYITGSSTHQTVDGYVLSLPNESSKLWPHGQILGTVNSSGDATVPLRSLEQLAPSSLNLKGDHGTMVGEGQLASYIRTVLLGDFEAVSDSLVYQPHSYMVVYASAPTALSVISPTGKVSAQKELSGLAYYSGDQAEIPIMVIPDPENGRYRIEATLGQRQNIHIGVGVVDPDLHQSTINELDLSAQGNTAKELVFDTITQEIMQPRAVSYDVISTSLSTTFYALTTGYGATSWPSNPISLDASHTSFPDEKTKNPYPYSPYYHDRRPSFWLPVYPRKTLLISLISALGFIIFWIIRSDE